MLMFEGFHHDKKVPIIIKVIYDEEDKVYIVEVMRGLQNTEEEFEPNHQPQDKLMHISDVENAVKIANNLIKSLKRRK